MTPGRKAGGCIPPDRKAGGSISPGPPCRGLAPIYVKLRVPTGMRSRVVRGCYGGKIDSILVYSPCRGRERLRSLCDTGPCSAHLKWCSGRLEGRISPGSPCLGKERLQRLRVGGRLRAEIVEIGRWRQGDSQDSRPSCHDSRPDFYDSRPDSQKSRPEHAARASSVAGGREIHRIHRVHRIHKA